MKHLYGWKKNSNYKLTELEAEGFARVHIYTVSIKKNKGCHNWQPLQNSVSKN
jgi:hypothetical protein